MDKWKEEHVSNSMIDLKANKLEPETNGKCKKKKKKKKEYILLCVWIERINS